MPDPAPTVPPAPPAAAASSPLAITVTAGSDRLSRRQQIEQILERARMRGEGIRVRLPLSIYDYSDARSYVFLRDAAWNLQLPSEQTTPDTIEELIEIIGECLVAIAQQGSQRVRETLRELGEETR